MKLRIKFKTYFQPQIGNKTAEMLLIRYIIRYNNFASFSLLFSNRLSAWNRVLEIDHFDGRLVVFCRTISSQWQQRHADGEQIALFEQIDALEGFLVRDSQFFAASLNALMFSMHAKFEIGFCTFLMIPAWNEFASLHSTIPSFSNA